MALGSAVTREKAQTGDGTAAQPSSAVSISTRDNTVVFIGMRGAGKTTLSKAAFDLFSRLLHPPPSSSAVEWIDCDEELVIRYNREMAAASGGGDASVHFSVSDIVAREGWPGFREREKQLLFDLLAEKPGKTLQRDERSPPIVRIVSCGGGVVETEACRELLKLHCSLGSSSSPPRPCPSPCPSLRCVMEIRRDIRDIESYLMPAPAPVAPVVGDRHAHRPAYAANATLRETYERRKPWFRECSSHTFVLPYFGATTTTTTTTCRPSSFPLELLGWESGVKPLFIDWFSRVIRPHLHRLLPDAVKEKVTPFCDASRAAFEASPWSALAQLPGDGAASLGEVLLRRMLRSETAGEGEGRKAAGESTISSLPLPLLPPPTSFPCITLDGVRGHGLWGLLPEEELLKATGVTTAEEAIRSLSFTGLCESPLLARLADTLFALTSGAGSTCSGVELRADTLLRDLLQLQPPAAGGCDALSDAARAALVEERLSYTLFLYRYCWSLGFKRRAYGVQGKSKEEEEEEEASAAVERRPAVEALTASGLHLLSGACPPLIFTVRTKSEGGAVAFEDPTTYCRLVEAALKLGHIDCVDLEMGRSKGSPEGEGEEDAAWREALTRLYRTAALTFGATVIASCHWPGESTVPSEAAMVGAVERIFSLLRNALPFTPNSDIDLSASSQQQWSSLPLLHSLAAVKLIGSGPSPSTSSSSSSSLADLLRWISAASEAEKTVHSAFAGLQQVSAPNSLAAELPFPSPLSPPPLIALCMGTEGGAHFTRALNQHLTPVTHRLLPAKAAPGQLTALEILDFRRKAGMLPSSDDDSGSGRGVFNLFGAPIQGSPSPLMHNSAFEASGLGNSFVYGRVETGDADAAASEYLLGGGGESTAAVPRPLVFGGNVTIPLKQDLLPALSKRMEEGEGKGKGSLRLSKEVAAIGAVNTLLSLPTTTDATGAADGAARGGFEAHNTDWFGIALPLKLRLQLHQAPDVCRPERIGLVVGAGGTAFAACYALLSLSASSPSSASPALVDRVVVFNPRTPAKASEIAAGINRGMGGTDARAGPLVTPSTDLDADFKVAVTSGRVRIAAVVSTIPAGAGWTCPDWLFSSPSSSTPGSPVVVFDAAYRPRLTALLKQTNDAGVAAALPIEGAEMLIHQGALAWALWMARDARAPNNNLRFGMPTTTMGEPSFIGVPWAQMADAAYSVLEGKKAP